MRGTAVEVVCESCGGGFRTWTSRVTAGRGRFCSLGCKGAGTRTRVARTCRECQQGFEAEWSRRTQGYCTQACRWKHEGAAAPTGVATTDQRHYFAGLLDADGCWYTIQGRPGLVLSLSSETCPPVLTEAQSLWGGDIGVGRPPTENSRPPWRWRVQGRGYQALMSEVAPLSLRWATKKDAIPAPSAAPPLAWLAGMVDGDGCITLRSTGTPLVRVCLATQPLPASLPAYFGGACRYQRHIRVAAQHTWNWEWTGQEAVDGAARLLPHLRIKRSQAELLQGWENIAASENRTAAREQRQQQVADMRRLNQRGLSGPGGK